MNNWIGLLVELRAEVIAIISGVSNSRSWVAFDNRSPNSNTRIKIDRVLQRYLRQASQFGLYVVTRHTECNNPNHPSGDFPVSNRYGLEISYKDPRFIWNGDQFDQDQRYCVCPCSPDNEPTKHFVIDDVIFGQNEDLDNARKLYDILYDIRSASLHSGHKIPRSAARENLLKALLKINDAIMPISVDDFIETYIQK